jgi:hypothetical protein
MWISRREYNRRILQAEEDAKATIESIRSEVAKALEQAEGLIAKREAEATTAIAKSEQRVAIVESMLLTERRENRRAERHWASMFLRREKTFPLPPTAEEKAEAKQEAEEEKKKPLKLDEIQEAQREAIRRNRPEGVTEEEADQIFLQMQNAGTLN